MDRRFRDLTDKEREDPAILAHFGDSGMPRGSDWPELLKSERVVLFAEAGSGKTREMQAQAKRLTAAGKTAFFLPIEALDREDVRGILAMEPGEAERFDAWLAEGDQPGWLFLDAVDELKLTNGKLDLALGKVSRALGAARNRAHIILSCRPTDWRPVQDLETLNKRLPTGDPAVKTAASSDDAFLEPFRQFDKKQEKAVAAAPKLRLVVLLPLAEKQIRIFAVAMGITDPDAFLAEVRRQEAWSFARRPLDLKGLTASWKANRSLGTLLQQHEADVETSLRDKPDRADENVLPFDKAVAGAERLALAMLLTKTRTIRAPEQTIQESSDSTSLDPALILADWTEAEVKALLRRPIFDPATYGRVRFHHRSVQEFLAARRLHGLRGKGMTARQLSRLLFADRYDERVVIPSMRPVAAWLALWDADVAREAMAREPEILILNGDPQSLSLDTRKALLRSYVAAYSGGGWRGLEMPITEVRRLAQADLAPEIKHWWTQPHSNEEVTEFLLKLIWLGAMQDCAEIARDAALNDTLGSYARVLAIRALGESKRYDLLRQIADDMLAKPDRWPDRVVYSGADDIFPGAISIAELVHLLRRTPEPQRTVGGFSWTLYNLAETLEPGSDSAVSLRIALADLIWEGRQPQLQRWDKPVSSFAYMTPALAKLCLRHLQRGGSPDENIIRASVIANRFHGDNTLGREEGQALAETLAKNSAAREGCFLAEMAVMKVITPTAEGDERIFVVFHDGIIRGLILDDWDWLLRALTEQRDPEVQDTLFRGLMELWYARGRIDTDLGVLRDASKDMPALAEILSQKTTLPERSPVHDQWEQKHQQHLADRKAERSRVEKSWLDWKQEVERDPTGAFSSDRRNHSLSVLIDWLGHSAHSRNTIARQNWREIRSILGTDIGNAFEDGLKSYWRSHQPHLWSEVPPETRSHITQDRMIALTGLAVEAAVGPHWPHALTDAEAGRAAGWGTDELNGFPEWFESVVVARPEQVKTVLTAELNVELGEMTTLAHPRILSAIHYGSDNLKRLMAPTLNGALQQWPPAPDLTANEMPYCQNLDRVLAILLASGCASEELVRFCEQRFLAGPGRLAGKTWLQGVFACDLRRGADALKKGLAALAPEERQKYGIDWFASLFGNRDYSSIRIGVDGDPEILVELTQLAYQCVRRSDDVRHEGVYSSNTRDEAESARNRLLSALIGKSGSGAHKALLALANEPLFEHMSDRLRMMARQRAALDSESGALSASDYRSWEHRYETPPGNRDELFQVMLDRLDDVDHDIHNHDFNDRHVLRDVEHETDMQPLLAKKLADTARGQYQVTREEEVADKKETDIRLLATAFTGRAVVEIKIGDNWSVAQMENAIKDQLVAQYLRHANCSAGCLLITYAGRKGFEDPTSGKAISFQEVVERLKLYAASLEKAEQGRIRLGVIALDFRDPL